MKLRLLLADDNLAFRNGLKRLLEAQAGYEVVAEAMNGRDAVAQTLLHQPDIAILDYSMPELDGLSAASEILKALPQVQILILTQHDAPYTVQRALDSGVRGYVVKSDASHDLLPALDALRQHKVFISSAIARTQQ